MSESDEIRVGDRFELRGTPKYVGEWLDGERMQWTSERGDVHENHWPASSVRRELACGGFKRLPPKPRQPEPAARQNWRQRGTGKVHTLVSRWFEDGKPIGWNSSVPGSGWFDCRFTDGTLEYVGEAEPEKASGSIPPCQPPEAERDWSRWLPPKPLPDTGPKVFKEGQVWATRQADGFAVFRVGVDGTNVHRSLARGGTYGTTCEVVYADGTDVASYHAILVQDVGEPTPREPAVLYGVRGHELTGVVIDECAKIPAEAFVSRKQHRFDRYCVDVAQLGVDYGEGHSGPPTLKYARPLCLDCGKAREETKTCTPDPYWRRTYEHEITTKMVVKDDDTRREAHAREMELELAKGRYDVRDLLAAPGLGSASLCCPVRGMRGLLGR